MAIPVLRRPGRSISALLLLVVGTGGCRTVAPRSCGPAATPLRRAPVGWPNAPAGLPRISDEPFNALDENGWRLTERETSHGSGVSLAIDSSAPGSPPSVLAFTYGIGFPGGYEPGVVAYDPAAPVREAYFGLWWKASAPWQNHAGSGVNKIAFLYAAEGLGDIALIMFKADSDYTIQAVPEFPTTKDVRRLTPNVTATPVTLGAWHQIEWHVRYATPDTSGTGIVEWWLDGALQGRYADLKTPGGAGFTEYQIAPTWGGMGGAKTEQDRYCFDHAYISGR